MKNLFFTMAFFALSGTLYAQTNIFPANGSVGIGTITPSSSYKLDILGAVSAIGSESRFSNAVFNDPAPGVSYGVKIGNGGVAVSGYSLFLDNIGIGTAPSSSAKLAVNGNIRAKELKIEVANWPDYVFEKDYQLPTLEQTENHIKEKGHLPGIPSAAEVKAEGIEVGEMNAKLLKKIEELTLYLIELKKQNTQLSKRVTQIERKNK